MRRFGLLLTALLIAVPAQAGELRNSMPNAQLEHFKQEANRKAARFPEVYLLEGAAADKTIYLTFDDGPDRVNTPNILDILKARGVPATFFFLGKRIETAPDILRRAASEGHLILPHGATHVDFRKHPYETVINEQLLPVAARIESLTGLHCPKAFRPPYGAVTDTQIAAFEKAGYRIINWSVDSFDWMRGRPSGLIVREVMRYVHPGAVILLHSGSANRNTPKALEALIPMLRKAGYRFATIY